MFINLHSHTVLHPNENNYSTCTFFPSMCIFCQCVVYDLHTCQTAGVSKFIITFVLFSPCEVLTLGWNYNLGILFCSIMSLILERCPKKERKKKRKNFFFLFGAHHWSRQCSLDLPASSFLFYNFIIYSWYNAWIDTTKSNGRCIAVRKLTTEQTCSERNECFGWPQASGIDTRPMESVLWPCYTDQNRCYRPFWL